MRYRKLVQRPPSYEVTRTTCDVCGEEIRGEDFWATNDVEISAKLGITYPEADCRTVHEIDCCAKCFLERVKPTLERELGAKFRQRDAEDYHSDAYAVEEPK